MEYIDSNNTRSGIYCIFNTRNGKLYIGSAQNLRKRVWTHILVLMKGKHHNKHLQSAWDKYGSISFLFVMIEYCEIDKLIEREQYWLDEFKVRCTLYNASPTAGSPRGVKHTPEARKNMSEAQKRLNLLRYPKAGKPKTQKTVKPKAQKRAVQQIKGHILIATYSDCEEASKISGIHLNSILKVCNNTRKSAGGYQWKYVRTKKEKKDAKNINQSR